MRYVVLIVMGVLSALLSGTAFSTSFDVAGLGIQIDLVMLFTLGLVLVEKNIAPIVFATLTGLLMDILFSTTLGIYALSYTVAADGYPVFHDARDLCAFLYGRSGGGKRGGAPA